MWELRLKDDKTRKFWIINFSVLSRISVKDVVLAHHREMTRIKKIQEAQERAEKDLEELKKRLKET